VSDSDDILVQRSQRGERGAFEELVRRTSRLIYARIYLETGDAHRTEDLVQEAFLQAWRSLEQLSDPAGFRSWLYTIAHSVVVDDFRRSGRRKRSGALTGTEALGSVPDPRNEPGAAAEQKEQREQALSLLRSLPEEYREPLTLRYLTGADHETIARQLGISHGSLRGLLNRGMALLRAEMAKASGAKTVSSRPAAVRDTREAAAGAKDEGT